MTAKFINKRKERYYIKSVNKRNRRWYLSTVQSVEMERSFYCLPSHDVTHCFVCTCDTFVQHAYLTLRLYWLCQKQLIRSAFLSQDFFLFPYYTYNTVLSTRLSPFFWGWLLCLILWNSTHQELHKYANCRTL